jgi:hypothetical protein
VEGAPLGNVDGLEDGDRLWLAVLKNGEIFPPQARRVIPTPANSGLTDISAPETET